MTSIERESEVSFIEDSSILNKTIPSQFSSWCFRFVLDKNKMFLNDIVIE
jgi:hypothetical protein